MSKTSRITRQKRTMIKQLRKGKTSGYHPRFRVFTKRNRFYWLTGLFFTIMISLILYLDFHKYVGFRENTIAGRTYIARVDFKCVDVRKTEEMRAAKARGVPPVYRRIGNWLETVLTPFERLVTYIRNDNEKYELSRQEWAKKYGGDFPEKFAQFIKADKSDFKGFLETARKTLVTCGREGVLKEEELKGIEFEDIIIHEEGQITALGIFNYDDVARELKRELGGFKPEFTDPFILIIRKSLVNSIFFSALDTKTKQDDARDKVETQKKEVVKGTVIINEGERVTLAHTVELEAEHRAFKKSLTYIDKIKMFSGHFVMILIFVILLSLYLYYFRSDFPLTENKTFTYFFFVMIFIFLTKVASFYGIPANAVPVVFMGMVTAIIVNMRFAVMMVFILSLLTGSIFRVDVYSPVALFVSGVTGIYFCSHVRRRVRILMGGVLAGLVNALVVAGVHFGINNTVPPVLPLSFGGISGMGSGILLMGLLPLIEYIFDTTTDIRLLELSDQGHPLLRTLFLQAPGTYTHSLSVGNLSESAAEAIGANPLLARVSSYYHDIGKIFKPEYFIENQKIGLNKHDNLKPGLSSLIIASHTRDGVELAHEYNLPHQIINIIGEHHGTGKIIYFLEKARVNAGDNETVDEEFFRYPGPKPRSKESGVVLLADSIEAASRTLNDPSHASLRKMVERIVADKVADGQLDDTELTLVDLARIKETFTAVLYGIFHGRIEYPEHES